jgi:hydrogenase maturation protease
MDLRLVERIIDALLYEGYILYPYRASAIKNRRRWNFGVVYPEDYSLAQGGAEASSMQTECLLRWDHRAELDVKIRFLHLMAREVCESPIPLTDSREIIGQDLHASGALDIDAPTPDSWQEAVEREVDAPGIDLNEIVSEPRRVRFAFPAMRESTPLLNSGGQVVGVVSRIQRLIEGAVEVTAERAGDGLFKVAARVMNLTPLEAAGQRGRDEVLMRSLVSTHTILGARSGKFVSLLDPPEAFREAAASCRNIGTWPAMVGEEGEHDCLLSAPIILYDYPQVAPESAGDFYDGTEIDELLTLRVLTMTDQEKQEMRRVDERARQILERTEALPPELLMRLHGATRNLREVESDKR